MINANEIRAIQFARAGMNGYKQSEVEEYLEEVANVVEAQDRQIEELERRIAQYEKDERAIQTTLLNAQKMADRLTEEAKNISDEVTQMAETKARETLSEAEAKANDLIDSATKKAEEIVNEAQSKAQSTSALIEKATKERFEQTTKKFAEKERVLHIDYQKQLDALESMKNSVSEFKNDIIERYKQHIDLLSKIEAVLEEKPEPEPIPPISFINEEKSYQQETPEEEATTAESDQEVEEQNDQKFEFSGIASEVDEVADDDYYQEPDEEVEGNSRFEFEEVEDDMPQRRNGFKVMVDEDEEDEDEDRRPAGFGFFRNRK